MTTPKKKISAEAIILDITLPPVRLIYLADIFIKLTSAALFFSGVINLWIFTGIFFGISLLLAIGTYQVELRIKKKLRKEIGEELLGNFNSFFIEYAGNDRLVGFYTLMGLAISYWFSYMLIGPEHWYNYIFIFVVGSFMMVAIAVLAYAAQFPRTSVPVTYSVKKVVAGAGEPTITHITSQYQETILKIQKRFDSSISIDPIDVNDKQIAQIESSQKDINSKVDSYMLESVLIGSLTFSGFLSIAASDIHVDKPWFQEIMPGEFSQAFQSSTVAAIIDKLDNLITANNIFTVIMIESLFCSVFFILILALRIRYSNLSVQLDYLLRIMMIFNSKEEELNNMKLQQGVDEQKINARLTVISFKIGEAVGDANQFLKKIQPIVRLMSWYRTIGLVIFFAILTTSGLFFSVKVSVVILLIALSTWLFRVIETRFTLPKIRRLLHRH